MKKFMIGRLLAVLLSSPALALDQALVVSACGTTPVTYAAGQQRLPTVDTSGKLCLSSSGGGAPSGPAGGVLNGTYPNPGYAVQPLVPANNLSDLIDAATARNNLSLGALATVTPGTGVATALGINIGSAGAPVLFNGAGGTPSSLTGTNITGTASGLTAGAVTTNANLTGDITSIGNATTLVTAQPSAHTWAAAQTFTLAPVFTDTSGTRTALGLATIASSGSASDLSAGTVASARGGAGSISGALKGNGSGVVAQAACADLSNGTMNCSAAVGQLPGTATNDNAGVGKVGEYVETIVASGSAVPLTTATGANMGSVSLTAGDWDVTFVDEFGGNAATVVQSLVASVSLSSGNLDNANGRASTGQYGTTIFGSATGFVTQTVPSVRMSLSSTTTVYGVCYATFTINTANCWGRLSARRMR